MSRAGQVVIGLASLPLAAVIGWNMARAPDAPAAAPVAPADWNVGSWQSRIGGAGRWQPGAGGALVLDDGRAVYTLSATGLHVLAPAEAGGKDLCRALSRYRGGYPMRLDADYILGAKWYRCTIRPNGA